MSEKGNFRPGTTAGTLALFFLLTISLRAQPFGGIIVQSGTFNGNNVTCDSFDSTDPNHSIWQTNFSFRGINYGIWSNSLSFDTNSLPSRTANFHLISETSFVDVGNAKIYGYIHTTPGGVFSIKNSGSVGDLNWVHSGTVGLQPGHFRDDVNMTFSSLSLPNPTNLFQPKGWFPVVTGAPGTTKVIRIGAVYSNEVMVGAGTLYTNINNAGWVLPKGDGTTAVFKMVLTNTPWTCAATNIFYTTNSLSGNLYVDCQYGVLYLPNGMSSPIIVINTNADLTIYSGGDILFGTTINNTRLTRALTINDIAGHPISVSVSGNASGISKLYVPNAQITFNGGGLDVYDVVTEIVCYSLEVNGHFSFHCDVSAGMPPEIFSTPSNLIVQAGSNATFNVSTGLAPLNYQWFDNQTNPIPYGTNSSLTLTNVQLSDAGIYSVVVTNLYGAVTSSASLTIFTNATATLNNFSFNSANGQLHFFNSGVTGLTYTIQASTDLVNWIPLWTNVSPFTFTDTNNLSQRFYRSVYFP